MPAAATTTLEALKPLLKERIESIVPRITAQGGERWKYYAKARGTAARTRLFTILWVPGSFEDGGYFGGLGVSTRATLAVRTDYAGQQDQLMHLVQDDYQQLRDRLHSLSDFSVTNGLLSVQPSSGAPTSRAADTNQGRQALAAAPANLSNTFQIDHTFAVTYMQARATG